MDKEDKVIKEFLEKGFFEKAPEGFTGRVMQTVEQVDAQQKPVIFYGIIGYILLMFGAILSAFGILYYFDNEFVMSYFQSFGAGLSGLLFEFSKTGKYFISLPNHSPYLGLLIGIFIVIFALLGIEKVVFKKGRYANIFV